MCQLPVPIWEKLYNQKPDYSFLKTFGCACYPHLRLYNKNKLEFHTLNVSL